MNQTIIITGASQGIGAATARAFLEDGWTVGLVARNRDKLDAVCADHSHAIALPTDVGDADAVERSFSDFVAKAGRLDALFNNAGIGSPAETIDEISLDTWHDVVNVNLNGMFYCARAAFGQMRKQDPMGGRIINNGSISAHTPRWRSVPYTTTKHAITGLTKCLSLDGRPFNIACGQVDIGNAATPMTATFNEGKPQANGEMMPEPTMDVDHVAGQVLHMANLPLASNVQFVTIMASAMPFIGRG